MGTRDYKIFAYSFENKSRIIDLNAGKVLFDHINPIFEAKFSEKQKSLVFCDEQFKLYILQNYTLLIQINSSDLIYHIFLCSNDMKIIRGIW